MAFDQQNKTFDQSVFDPTLSGRLRLLQLPALLHDSKSSVIGVMIQSEGSLALFDGLQLVQLRVDQKGSTLRKRMSED